MSDKDKDIDPADDPRGSKEALDERSERAAEESDSDDDSKVEESDGDDDSKAEESDSDDDSEAEGEFFEEPWEVSDPLADAEDAIDPELLALAEERPPVKWYRPIVMIVVCVLIGVMIVWFRADVMYFFADTEIVSLGEAHDIRFSSEWENRYVEMEGIPLAPRNENPAPQCGSNQGFPTYQRRFFCRGHMSAIPVMGRPGHDLIIQRYMVRQLRIHYQAPDGRDEEETRQLVEAAARRVASVHDIRPAQQGELGRLIVDIEGTSGRTDITAVANSIRFQVEASVPNIRHVRVERVRREVPGHYRGRIVRLSSLGSRFAAVADYLNECTSYPIGSDAWVMLDGSEAGQGLFDSMGICYGQAPRQYWPYLVLYVLLISIFVLNIFLLVRFFRGLRKN
jgi:hypothetical protein